MTYPEKVAYTLRAKGQLSFRGDQDTLVVCCLKTTQPTAELPGRAMCAKRSTRGWGREGETFP